MYPGLHPGLGRGAPQERGLKEYGTPRDWLGTGGVIAGAHIQSHCGDPYPASF
ncbi:MAG: hypothetical protein ACP5LD_15780 [Desulfomonilaceae bacterium]